MSKEQKAAIAGLIILFTLSVGLFLGSLGTNTTEHAFKILEARAEELKTIIDPAQAELEVLEPFLSSQKSQ